MLCPQSTTQSLNQVSTHKVDDLLDESHSRFTPLQRLLKTAYNQKQWTAELQAFIAPPLRFEVSVTDIRGPNAHILSHSAAAATRLRFLLPEILPALQRLSNFANVTDFKIRVANAAVTSAAHPDSHPAED